MMLLLTFSNTIAQQIPGSAQKETISIVGATLHIGDGTLVENGTIVFEDGKILAIGTSANVEASGSIINAEGKHVFPGFIIPNTSLGLGEIDAVNATLDDEEMGTFLPHIRSLVAYNAESKVVESMRPNGVFDCSDNATRRDYFRNFFYCAARCLELGRCCFKNR